MFRSRSPRPRRDGRRVPGVVVRPSADLEPLAALHHSPVLVRAIERSHRTWR